MVQSENAPGGDVDIRVKVILLVEDAKRQLAELGAKLTGGASNIAGQAGAAMLGGGVVNVEGESKTKEQSERDKVRNTALQSLARSAPGGGLATSMAKSFSSGGMMAGMATGITAVVGILTNIMKSSQVFQTMAGTVFKILGMMADLFLMPFIPLMMRFATWMIKHMPEIQAAGEKVASFVEKLVGIFQPGGWLGGKEKESGSQIAEEKKSFLEGLTSFKTILGVGLVAAGVAGTTASFGILTPVGAGLIMAGGTMVASGMEDSFQMGGKVPGGPGESVQATLHGGEIVVPQDIAADSRGFGGRVAAWIQRFQQKEMGPGGVMERWYDAMFGGSIMPDIWTNIHGFFEGIETEVSDINKRVGSDTDKLEGDRKGFWDKLKFWEYIPEILGKIKGFFTGLGGNLKDLVTFDIPFIDLGDVASTVKACFSRAGGAVSNFFNNTILNPVRDAARGIGAAASWVGSSVGTVVTAIEDAFSLAGESAFNFFFGTLLNWVGEAAGKVADAAGWVKHSVYEATGWVYDKLTAAGYWVHDFFKYTLWGWVSEAATKVENATKSVLNFASSLTDKSWSGIQFVGTVLRHFFFVRVPQIVGNAAVKVYEAMDSVKNLGANVFSDVKNSMNYLKLRIEGKVRSFGSQLMDWGKGILGIEQFGNTSSNSAGYLDIMQFGNRVSNMRHFGGSNGGGPRVVMGMGGMASGNGGVTSNRVVNVNITSSMSIHDIVRDVERLDSIQEAAFFNTV